MRFKLFSFINSPWSNLIGMLIGFVGIILSVYFYNLTKQERQPAYVIDPGHISIIDSLALGNTPLMLSDSSGRQINGDVSLSKLYFWNAGNLSIRRENVLEPINISVGEGSEIIDYRIIKSSRALVRPEIKPVLNSDGRKLELSFDILEGMDGVAIQLVYLGRPPGGLSVNGTIEGASSFLTNQDLVTGPFWKELAITISAIIFLITSFQFAFSFTDWLEQLSRSDRVNGKVVSLILLTFRVTKSLVGIGLIVLAVFFLIAKPVITAKMEADKKIVNVVPLTLTSIN